MSHYASGSSDFILTLAQIQLVLGLPCLPGHALFEQFYQTLLKELNVNSVAELVDKINARTAVVPYWFSSNYNPFRT